GRHFQANLVLKCLEFSSLSREDETIWFPSISSTEYAQETSIIKPKNSKKINFLGQKYIFEYFKDK
ncbi:hypothetical protein, partial [Streptomyces sp. IBSBF 2390]|uniref:hypothetical protein n=1 Tax=Streptomyces sp. IBSBF 2390 TaxID=2903533 RepID=UPI002FDB9EC4